MYKEVRHPDADSMYGISSLLISSNVVVYMIVQMMISMEQSLIRINFSIFLIEFPSHGDGELFFFGELHKFESHAEEIWTAFNEKINQS